MTKRHAWWVIVMGEAATAFRAREREELLPTLKQLQHTQPEAALKWFERGRLWTSPEEAQAAAREARRARGAGRSRDWRPGGAHVDPRAKYKLTRDQKRARWKQREGWRRERDDEGSRGGTFDARGPRDPRGQPATARLETAERKARRAIRRSSPAARVEAAESETERSVIGRSPSACRLEASTWTEGRTPRVRQAWTEGRWPMVR
jgi:hypothetical protein